MKTIKVKRIKTKPEFKSVNKPVELDDKAFLLEKPKNESTIVCKKEVKPGGLLAITMALGIVMFISSCTTSSEKVKNAQEDVSDAKEVLQQAQEDYAIDLETYRIETTNKIEANRKSIIALRARIENEKKEAKAEYTKQIADLEQKNSDMKKRIIEYKADSKESWQSFKTEFKKDMDDLELAIQNFLTKD
jgi:phosphoenolpyruvate-protein kinase (PTS system EI component)